MTTKPKLIYCSECGRKNRIRYPDRTGVWGCGSCHATIFDNTARTKPTKKRKSWDRFLGKTLQELSEAKSQLRVALNDRSRRGEIESIKANVVKIRSRFEGLKAHLDYIADDEERTEVGRTYRTEFIIIQDMLIDIEHAPAYQGFWARFSSINANTAAIVGSVSSVTILVGAILSTVGIPNPLMAIGYGMKGQKLQELPKPIDV